MYQISVRTILHVNSIYLMLGNKLEHAKTAGSRRKNCGISKVNNIKEILHVLLLRNNKNIPTEFLI